MIADTLFVYVKLNISCSFAVQWKCPHKIYICMSYNKLKVDLNRFFFNSYSIFFYNKVHWIRAPICWMFAYFCLFIAIKRMISNTFFYTMNTRMCEQLCLFIAPQKWAKLVRQSWTWLGLLSGPVDFLPLLLNLLGQIVCCSFFDSLWVFFLR